MKFNLCRRIFSLVILLFATSYYTTAADYYVVVGTFVKESNARQYTQSIRKVFKEASYSFNSGRNVFYVHVMKTSQKERARDWSIYLRRQKVFGDAWVLTEAETFGDAVKPKNTSGHRRARYNKDIRRDMFAYQPDVMSAARAETIEKTYSTETKDITPVVTTPDAVEVSWIVKDDITFTTNADKIKRSSLSRGSSFLTFIVEDTDGVAISADVMLVNFEKMKTLASFPSGQQIAIRPTRREQTVTVVCEVLGYAQETRMFNLDHLSREREVVQNEGGVWEVRIKLKKMQVNDVSFMNRTTFYAGASVFESSSQGQLDELFEMMEANPAYKIIVHSHCNPGDTRALKVASGNNFFDVENATEKSGSDKMLTKMRAEAVRDYLVSRGISKKRVGILGWGSADQLTNKAAEDSYINDRIEVELVSD